jgi:hypothetical protein
MSIAPLLHGIAKGYIYHSCVVLNEFIGVKQEKLLLSIVCPQLVSDHLCSLSPKLYYKIQLQFGTSEEQTLTDSMIMTVKVSRCGRRSFLPFGRGRCAE